MEAQVPKKIQKPKENFPNFPGMDEIFESLVPRQIPRLEYEQGCIGPLFKGFIHNWKLKQIELDTTRRANIAREENRLLDERIKGIFKVFSLGEQYQAYLKTIRHGPIMLQIEEEKGLAEVDKIRMTNLVTKAEYDRLIAESKAITFQLENKHAVEASNGNQEG